MAGVYFRDKNINKNGTGTKRSSREFNEILNDLFPNKPPIQKEKSTQLGFIINFVNDDDANSIFDQEIKSKLSAKNMSAELSSPSRLDREIFLIDVPFEIYNKSILDITAEIVRLTPYKILDVIKFCGNSSGKNYIIFTVPNKATRDTILNYGPMPLFKNPTQTRKPLRKNNSTNSFDQFHHANPVPRSHPPLQANSAWQSPASLAQQHPRPSQAAWQNPLTHPNNWPILPQGTPLPWGNASLAASNSSGSSPPPRADQASPTNSDQGQSKPPIINKAFEMNLFIQASTVICKNIHEGMENPEEYVCNLNEL